MPRAIGLLSGGLDSMLAAKVLLQQGVEVLALSFSTPFFGSKRGEQAAANLGVPFRAVDITDVHLEMVKNPKHGYGRNMNPCIDCHAMMLNYAGKLMEEEGYDFLFTGEVLGQRPKSQRREALGIVAKESGYPDYVVRPLCAKHLKPTKPELDGIIDREKLLDLEGRSRKPQMALAQEFGITEYPSPAGGCLLTDPAYSKRLRELFDHDPDATVNDVRLLKVGRHFRLGDNVKFVLGREHAENLRLSELLNSGDIELYVAGGVPGPTGLLRGDIGDAGKRTAAAICARYSDADKKQKIPVILKSDAGEEELLVMPASEDTIQKYMIQLG